MKPHLLYRDKDLDLEADLPWNAATLTSDLELQVLFDCMSAKEKLPAKVIENVMLNSIKNDRATILYRQEILKDCIANHEIIEKLYTLSISAIESRRKGWFIFSTDHPTSILSGSVRLMEVFKRYLYQLRIIVDEHAHKFRSEGFLQFIHTLQTELDEAYFNAINENLTQLSLQDEILIGVHMGEANKGMNYSLQHHEKIRYGWWHKIFPPKIKKYHFNIHPRDIGGIRALREIKDETVNRAGNALAQSADHILQFFTLLQQELAFYLGCLHLYDRLKALGEPIVFPEVMQPDSFRCVADDLYDPCLALSLEKGVESNQLNTHQCKLVVVTGANQGGKTTFLRSIGLARLMMQSGMFVAATTYSAPITPQIFTHFKKEEDSSIKSGKFDEELSRMNDIAAHLRKGSLILFNESFAATNEREGSEVASQIITALTEKNMQVFFVTHLYDFALKFYKEKIQETLFLRAERFEDGHRNFKLTEAPPLPTSFGSDLYKKVFKDIG